MSEHVARELERISQDQEHGAGFLAREALKTMKIAAVECGASGVNLFLREMATLGCRLISLRPSMSAPIANGVVRAFEAITQAAKGEDDLEKVRAMTCEVVDRLLAVAEKNVDRIVKYVAEVVPRNAMVLTHSYSETCLRSLLACSEKGIRVFATESRPLLEGRKMAVSLRQGGIDATLITDAEAGHFMSEVQLVLVGADTVLDDGAVVNKMGTCLIALAATDRKVPFYVACDSWKVRIESGVPHLEEKSAEEVVEKTVAVPARNICFDVTPARLITAIITEDGKLRPKEVVGKGRRWRRVLERMSASAR
jgi:ribose 1,5-bisphosphate isomerase